MFKGKHYPPPVNETLKKVLEQETSSLNDIIDTNSDPDLSTDYDAIIFFTGTAFASVLEVSESKNTFLEFYQNSASSSLMELCNDFPEFKNQLNAEIKNALEVNIYSDWKESTIGSVSLGGSNFDFISLFNRIINTYERDEVLTFYKPEGLDAMNINDEFYLGLDIPTLNKDEALLFNNGSKFLVSEDLANKLNILFLGINKPNAGQPRYDYFFERKLDKWYGYGKVTLESNNQVEAWWMTKYRWYSNWKLKEINTLSSQGATTYYYYWGYRIASRVRVWQNNIPPFTIYQKHFSTDPNWEVVYHHN